jgi:hypothetical protein
LSFFTISLFSEGEYGPDAEQQNYDKEDVLGLNLD